MGRKEQTRSNKLEQTFVAEYNLYSRRQITKACANDNNTNIYLDPGPS